MTSDQVIRLLGAIAGLIGVLVWPVALVILFVCFRANIGKFIESLSEFTLKTPAIEATAKRQAVEAAAALGAAQVIRTSGDGRSAETLDPKSIADAVLPGMRSRRPPIKPWILWVDDRPGNNVFERQALEIAGIEISQSESTEDALRKIQRGSYDLIISDMDRPPDSRAGYTLLDQLREDGNAVPFVMYSGSKRPEHVREARAHGAVGATNDPQELFLMVTRVLND